MKLNEIKDTEHPRLANLNAALAELTRDEDDEPHENEAREEFNLEIQLYYLADKYDLNDAEIDLLRDVCEGPIGGPFSKYPL